MHFEKLRKILYNWLRADPVEFVTGYVLVIINETKDNHNFTSNMNVQFSWAQWYSDMPDGYIWFPVRTRDTERVWCPRSLLSNW
jgi:hypothetical protein